MFRVGQNNQPRHGPGGQQPGYGRRPYMRVLYVTSFSPDLFIATGRSLLQSYCRIGSPDRMLVCHEGVPDLDKTYGVETYDLTQDAFLQKWLTRNRDIIPQHLGGDLPPCDCPVKDRHAKHKAGCVQNWMRRNAARWFRKVASWRYAARLPDVDVICWMDSDCTWHNALPHSILQSFFGGTSVFYFRAHRPAIESGLLGFDLRREGRKFIDRVCDIYTSGDFRREDRWDDGYIVTKVVDEKKIRTRDMVPGKKNTNHVVLTSSITHYISHEKGSHGRILDIMR